MTELTTTPRTHRRGERGIAIMMTALLLIPLMIFAAFGVDLASWYARISELQRAADAAALAGAVWMPDLGRATTEATASLGSNGIVAGTDGMTVLIERGSTPTALRVTVTDTDATRYFSGIFMSGPNDLSRFAEAEYNLPLPLGSPLNYFGADATRTQPATVTNWSVNWPSDYNTRAPANPACNVGTAASQNLGRWSGTPPTYSATGFSGSTQCVWTVGSVDTGGPATTFPPPDYQSRPPTNGGGSGCVVRTNGTGAVLGRWLSGAFTAGSFGSPTTVCTFRVMSTVAGTIPPFAGSRVPTNQPCRVGYDTVEGWWSGSVFRTTAPPAIPAGGANSTGNQLCRWSADLSSVDATPPNPISSTRSPGFWAAIEGPQTNAYQGEIYSTRCYGGAPSCGSVQNAQYQTGANRGFWYLIRIPSGLSGNVAINIYDASYVRGSTDVQAGDRGLDGSTTDFPTRFQVYEQTNPLDFNSRSPLFTGSPGTTDGSCNWEVTNNASHSRQWRHLCTLTGVQPGDVYQLNVQTVGTSGAGVNGYAIEAVANGSHSGTQPALYAFGSMAMQNNNTCSPTPCSPPPSTFYLAEVGPQYAGKVLVMELWDPGDVAGTADMSPMRPSPTLPRPVVNVPAADCTFTAETNPNGRLGVTGTEYLTPQPSDNGTTCTIRTATSGTSRFNGEWLRIRIRIPSTYTCTLGVNPETTAGSCWWGIRYSFSGGGANDVTTWQARIEGNPLQLTQ
jgi:hypothetical protein